MMASGFTRPLEVTNHQNKSYRYAEGGKVRDDDEKMAPGVMKTMRGFDENAKLFGRTHPGNLTRHAKGGLIR
jgi:hypothetical protein